MDGFESVFEPEHSGQVVLRVAKKGEEILLDHPVSPRNVRNFGLTSRWSEKIYKEILFFVIGGQSTAQLLVISGWRNLKSALRSIENTNREFSGSQYDEDRLLSYFVFLGNDPDLIFDLVGKLLDLRVQLRVELLKLKLAHVEDVPKDTGIDLVLQPFLFSSSSFC